jgi:hypothetical protein
MGKTLDLWALTERNTHARRELESLMRIKDAAYKLDHVSKPTIVRSGELFVVLPDDIAYVLFDAVEQHRAIEFCRDVEEWLKEEKQ